MRFDMNNIHTIFESAKSKSCEPSEHADKSGAKIDATLGDSDLIGLFDNICPIRGDVFASMKDAAADPKNLKLTMVKTEDLGESTKIYIEAVEFATFCEAADLNIGEAAEEILDTCNGMVPGSNDSELHVVFPSDSLNKGELGSTRFGRDVRNDWAMQLLTGCRRYGIHVNSGVEDGEPVTESAYKKAESEAINEGVIKKIAEKMGKNRGNSKEAAFAGDQKHSNVVKLNVAGKERLVYFQDKFKKYEERKNIEDSAISEVKAAIGNEESIKKKIYDFILKEEGHDDDIDKDSKSNAGYLDYFEVVEHGDGYTINATMANYQYMITCLKNGKPSSESKVIYLD